MQHFDEYSLNSISYSMIQTQMGHKNNNSDDSCTCGHDNRAIGDGLFQNRPPYPNQNGFDPYSKQESTNNYGTATEHELIKPYPKQIADRFEAEYDYCMRWASDRKFIAAKVIPFQSNFYSVVRLTFTGKNWTLDCANFDNVYDYCGWLPNSPTSSNSKKPVNPLLKKKEESLMTDSSEFLSYGRQEAGKTVHPSETGFGLYSLKTDYSEDSGLTKEPIDTGIYNIVGDSSSDVNCSLHSTLEDISPILHQNEQLTVAKSVSIDSIGSTGSSLKAVFKDLVELDEIFKKEVVKAKKKKNELEDYVNSLTTALSFSESALETPEDFSMDLSTVTFSDSEVTPVKDHPTMLAQLACLAGRKISLAFWKNWTKTAPK